MHQPLSCSSHFITTGFSLTRDDAYISGTCKLGQGATRLLSLQNSDSVCTVGVHRTFPRSNLRFPIYRGLTSHNNGL